MSAFFFLSDIYKENSSTMDETKVDIDLINGTPVCKIEGDEFLPVQGMTFVQQIEQFFNKQGGKASSPFGDVMLNKKGVKADKNHGMSRIKAATFAAVKDVLEKGKIILPLDYHKVHNKKELTGMVAAPILVGEDRYICVVEVIKNLKEQRLYVHEAFLTKNLQEVVASSHVRDSNDATSRQPQGEVANVLINHLKNNTGVSGSGKSQLTDNNKTNKNESKNMNKKNTIRLTESDLKRVISESLKRVLKEDYVETPHENKELLPILRERSSELRKMCLEWKKLYKQVYPQWEGEESWYNRPSKYSDVLAAIETLITELENAPRFGY
jgi:hypothetical protein